MPHFGEQFLHQKDEVRPKNEGLIDSVYSRLSARLLGQERFVFGEREQAILKLKLDRYFQRESDVDLNTLFDAIIETPNFITTEKGGLHRLLKIHEQKTLIKIAEIRKQRAEISGHEEFNPYENLFTTASGKYYLARLLNMPHLEEESAYMKHCVGASDSYVNKIKRGEVEILSLRSAPTFNDKTQRLEGDNPILTIEYDPKSKTIIQMKKKNDGLIDKKDILDLDIWDVLEQASATADDTGKSRDFSKIVASELNNIKVADYHLLTKNGEVHYHDFNPDIGAVVLKVGNMPLEGLPKIDVAKIAQIFTGLKIKPEQIAQDEAEVAADTKIYIGPLFPGIFDLVQKYNIEHIYTSFPEGKIRIIDLEIGGMDAGALEKEFDQKEQKISYDAHFLMKRPEFKTGKKPEQIKLARLTVKDLGFPEGATTDEIYERAEKLGLELCPPEVGPRYRLQYTNQPMDEWLYVGMKQISSRGSDPDVYRPGRDPHAFKLIREIDGSWLHVVWAKSRNRWFADDGFVFRLRPSKATASATANAGQAGQAGRQE